MGNIWKRDLREGGRGPRWPAHPSKPYMGTGRLAACSSLVGEAIEAGDSSDVGAEHSLLLRLLDPPTYTQPATPLPTVRAKSGFSKSPFRNCPFLLRPCPRFFLLKHTILKPMTYRLQMLPSSTHSVFYTM